MKSLTILTAFIAIAVASPVVLNDGVSQLPFTLEDTSYPGFDLDLTAQRLVQVESQPPIWMSELEKVSCHMNAVQTFVTESPLRSRRKLRASSSLTCEQLVCLNWQNLLTLQLVQIPKTWTPSPAQTFQTSVSRLRYHFINS